MKVPILFFNAGVYTFSNVLNKAIPFLLLPVLTRFLSPQDFGVIAMFSVLVQILTPFIGLNSYRAFTRKYYSNDPDLDLTSYVTNCFYIAILLFLFFGTTLLILRHAVSRFTSIPSGWVVYAALISLGNIFSLMTLTSYQVKLDAFKYALFSTTRTITNLSLSVIFVVVLLMGWQGRVLGLIITATICALLGLFLLSRQGLIRLGKPYNSKNIKHLVHFGVPLIPHTLGDVINNAVDKIFITNLVGLADTGIYTIGYQFGMIIGLLEDSFNKAFVPWLFEKLSKGREQDKLKIVRFTYLYFIAILVLVGLFTLVSPFFLRIMVAKEFQGAVVYVLWIALAYAFSGMYKMVVSYIFYAEKTYLLSLVTATKTILNIVLNYILIKANGPLGAAQATALSFFLGFIMTWVLSARVYKMPWKAGFIELFKLNGRL